MELMRTTMFQVTITWRPFEFYTTAALIYVFLVWISNRGIRLLERKLQVA
jgi:ABC-type arginine transport system permease subunit